MSTFCLPHLTAKTNYAALERRGSDPVYVDHEANSSLLATTSLEEIFAGHHSVVLFPEEEEGPYRKHI